MVHLSNWLEEQRLFSFFTSIGLLAVILGYGIAIHPIQPAADSISYLSGAYHLRIHSVYSGEATDETVPPAIGREPGYSILLAAMMLVDSSFGSFRPSCLLQTGLCDSRIYRTPQWMNAGLIGAAGFTLFALVHRLTGRRLPALVSALYVLANVQMNKGFYDIISDPLAVWLTTLTMWLAAWAWQARPSPWRWACVGLGLAALTFTKAIFLYCALLVFVISLGICLIRSGYRRTVMPSLIAVTLAFALPTGGWLARNTSLIGVPVFTDLRSGIALSTREVFNHMSSEQYLTAFVYWTRGFGDGLARRIFPAEVVAPFDLEQPGGFYDVGQNGYGHQLAALEQEEGLGEAAAVKRLDRQLIAAILERPLTHLVTTLPVFYRGIWVDEFIVIGLPIFLITLIGAIRRRDGLIAALLGLGAFNLLFYALISLNITRYQMTAVPAIALACGLALHRWIETRRAL
jgi:hypothetical protein